MLGTAQAQDTTRTRPPRDTLRTRPDTLRQRTDTSKARTDTARTRADTLRAPGDTTRRPQTFAVPIPGRQDTTRRDTTARDTAKSKADSIAEARKKALAADTLKRALAHAQAPPVTEIDGRYRWDRNAIFSSGAVNLLELLETVPGLTGFRSGWVTTPHTATYLGDFGRLRVSYDGLELDPLDLRMGGMLDLTSIQLWTLEEVAVERAADELRVYLRSWRVQKTTPVTRVDVSTGDLESNSYRGYYGKRAHSGAALQFGAQQFSTTDLRNGGGGALRGYMGRIGVARGRTSLDAFFVRAGNSRDEELRTIERPRLPPLDATRTTAYIRGAYGDPDAGPWGQIMLASDAFHEGKSSSSSNATSGLVNTGSTTSASDTVDTTASRAQYVVTGGLTRWGLRLSGTGRVRIFEHHRLLSPSARASFERSQVTASVFVNREAADSTMRLDAIARWQPLGVLSLAGSVGRTSRFGSLATTGTSPPDSSTTTTQTAAPAFGAATTAYRGELGLRLRRVWITGGLMALDTSHVRAPVVYDTGFKSADRGAVKGTFVTLRGTLWKAIGIDVMGTKWTNPGFYQPQYQTRSQIYLSTGLLDRFPSGNFHILAAVTHEYRSAVRFPTGATTTIPSSEYRSWTSLVEIRLLSAVLTWQNRNFIRLPYEQVPGFFMPRGINYYGVRWEFLN